MEIPISTDKVPINTDNHLTERERLILEYVAIHGSITNQAACELLHLKDSSVKKLFAAMVKKGLLIAIGERKSRRYEQAKK